jgi:hypothetical protein
MGLPMTKDINHEAGFGGFSMEDTAFILKKKVTSIKKYRTEKKLIPKKFLGEIVFTFEAIKDYLVETSENITPEEADFILRGRIKELEKSKLKEKDTDIDK